MNVRFPALRSETVSHTAVWLVVPPNVSYAAIAHPLGSPKFPSMAWLGE